MKEKLVLQNRTGAQCVEYGILDVEFFMYVWMYSILLILWPENYIF